MVTTDSSAAGGEEAAPSGEDDPDSAPDGREEDLDRVLTVPNLITLTRLLCLPYYVYLLIGHDNRVGAAAVLGALGATDWVDGYVARHFNQKSNLGRLMDPTVDRVLFFVGIGGIIAVNGAPLWFCVAVLVREAVVASTTVTLTVLGVEPVEVTWFGKAGTFCLMFAFPIFLAGSSGAELAPALTIIAWGFAIPGIVLSYYAAVLYVPRWTKAFQLHQLERTSDPQRSFEG